MFFRHLKKEILIEKINDEGVYFHKTPVAFFNVFVLSILFFFSSTTHWRRSWFELFTNYTSQVTIIGAGSDVGRIAALFLKQQKVVKRLTLYDDEPDKSVMGVATDLAHIDTSTDVQAYQGRVNLGEALKVMEHFMFVCLHLHLAFWWLVWRGCFDTAGRGFDSHPEQLFRTRALLRIKLTSLKRSYKVRYFCLKLEAAI